MGIGIESFHNPSLREMKKNQTATEIVDAIRLTREVGLHLGEGGMLFGYENDGWEAMRANVAALTELGHFNTTFAVPCPFPGTALYDKAVKMGHIVDEEAWLMELADLDVAARAINMSGLPDDELQRIIQWGTDQLAVNSVRRKYPILAGLLSLIQPLMRSTFGFDTVRFLYGLKRGRLSSRDAGATVSISLNTGGLNIVREKGISRQGADDSRGQHYIVHEALQRLANLRTCPAVLPFLGDRGLLRTSSGVGTVKRIEELTNPEATEL